MVDHSKLSTELQKQQICVGSMFARWGGGFFQSSHNSATVVINDEKHNQDPPSPSPSPPFPLISPELTQRYNQNPAYAQRFHVY